jgi:uncharacterized Zn finger protein
MATIAEPKCPVCGAEGANSFAVTDSVQRARNGDVWFQIVHCAGCGHVYGVYNKIVHGPTLPVLRADPFRP